MVEQPHVALLIETSREYGRGLLRGVMRYLREHRPWSLYVQARGTRDPLPTWLKNWRGDGILARIENKKMASVIQATGIPTVDLRFALRQSPFPGVGIDNRSVVQLAVEHFLSRGFERFAYCGLPAGQFSWMDLRGQLFSELAHSVGCSCETFAPPAHDENWEQEQRRLARWVKALPKPIAIMACNDERGVQLLDACRRAHVQVPDEVSVLGVDNDELLCGLSNPAMSSIDINVERVGYQSAALLQRLMEGHPAPAEPQLYPASAVVTRQSTDSYAVDDPQLQQALRYLRQHACEGIRMQAVTRATGMERRTLERKMKALLGRTPKEELLRIQLEEARRLLAHTNLSVKRVAGATGFANSRYFSRAFRMRVGMTPLSYRRHARQGESSDSSDAGE